jgi:hypothetical protein
VTATLSLILLWNVIGCNTNATKKRNTSAEESNATGSQNVSEEDSINQLGFVADT